MLHTSERGSVGQSVGARAGAGQIGQSPASGIRQYISREEPYEGSHSSTTGPGGTAGLCGLSPQAASG